MKHRGQAGYTLIELVIAMALGVIVMTSLTSVVLTTMQAANTASSRIEASVQIRDFELTAYDDFALSSPPTPMNCGSASRPCSEEPLVLEGMAVSNTATPAPGHRAITYAWNRSRRVVTRTSASGARDVATNVFEFGWYVEGAGSHKSVVVTLTVKVELYNASHVQSQTLRFFPRVTP